MRRRAGGDRPVSVSRQVGLTDFPRCGNNASVIRGLRFSRCWAALSLAAAVGLLPGCTLLDSVLPGTPFTPDQPLAQVTVVGEINVDPATGNQDGCSPGKALLWGNAKNTGDVDVTNVFIEIDALTADKGVLGSYRTNVFNGVITGGTPEDPNTNAGTSLTVGQSGTFAVCANLSAGSVAGTAYRTDFIVLDVLK